MKLKLKKEIIENKCLSNNAIMTYVGVVSCYKYGFNEIFVNKSMINYYLTKKTTIPRRFEEALREGLKELIEKNVLECNYKNSFNYYFSLKNVKLEDGDTFIFVDFQDVQKIMSYEYQGKISLLRFYICLLGTFLSKNNIQDVREPDKYNNILGMMSQNYLSDISCISKHSVIEYTKILESLNMIYVNRCSFMFRDVYGNIRRHNNVYGKYENKSIIDEFVKIKYNMYDELHKVNNEKIMNAHRSLMQKYNCLCNGQEYDEKTIEDIFKHIVNYNNKYPKKEKDLTIFKQYGYVID